MKISEIIVKTVAVEKLIENLIFPLNDKYKIDIHPFCIYKDLFEIDTDCCFYELTSKLHDGKIQKVIEIAARIKKYKEDGSFTLRMDQPDFYISFPIDKYLELATDVKLVDFIRYNYNPRIMDNQNLLMRYIRKQNN